MIVVTLLAVPCAYVGWQAKIVRERKLLRAAGVAYFSEPDICCFFDPHRFPKPATIPRIRERLGDEAVQLVSAYISASTETCVRLRAAFPEAEFDDSDTPHSGL